MSTLSEVDAAHLRRAIELAAATWRNGNLPYGAVLVGADGAVLAEGANIVNETGDITTHAESAALRWAGTRHGLAALAGSTMYASGESCSMCASAMVLAGVRRVVYALDGADMPEHLQPHTDYVAMTCKDLLDAGIPRLELEGPVLADEALEMLKALAPREDAVSSRA
jgi:tRNA(Arg) A34 adenosine deaminase TadA